jgi:hypothetical protein
MLVAMADGEHPEPVEDEEPVVEMETGMPSYRSTSTSVATVRWRRWTAPRTQMVPHLVSVLTFLLVGRILC